MFKCEIKTDNAAFGKTDWEEVDELICCLKGIIERLECGGVSGYINDTNGNTIGKWSR